MGPCPGVLAREVRQACAQALEFRSHGVCENGVTRPSLLQVVRKQGTFGSICHAAGQLPTQALAIWGFRSRSPTRRADEAGQTPAIARATLSTARDVAGKARRAGQPGGTARKDLAADDRGLRSRS